MLKNIAQYVDNQLSCSLGVDLFHGWRPEGVADDCITLLERTGRMDNFYIPGCSSVPVQIISRSVSYGDGLAGAWSVINLFCGVDKAGITLPTLVSGEIYRVNAAETISGPFWMGQDEKGRHEFSANILLHAQLN